MASALAPATNLLSGGLGILKYWWIVAIFIIIGIIGIIIFVLSKYKAKKAQWTHTLILKSEKANGELYDDEEVFKMRRWYHNLEKTPPLFELERPITGSRIMVELPNYDGRLSYTIVLGNDGRIYLPKKTTFSKDNQALDVSVKHAAIDRARQLYGNQFEKMHETPKRIDGLTLMKYGIIGLAIIATMVLGIVALSNWSERASANAQIAQSEIQSYQALAEMGETMKAVTNLQLLMIPDIKKLYGNNIQGAIEQRKLELNQDV